MFYKEKIMRNQWVKKKTLIGFTSLSAAPLSFLFVNIVFLTAYLQREDNEKTMSKKENLNWVYLFKRSTSFLSLCEWFYLSLKAYLQREKHEGGKRKSTFNFLSL